MNFYWRRVESQEKLQRRGNSVHNITLVGFRGQKVVHVALYAHIHNREKHLFELGFRFAKLNLAYRSSY